MKRRLDDVRNALGDGKLPEAEEALRESAATKAFAKEYAALKTQVAEARKKAAPPAAVPSSGTEKAPPAAQSAAAKAQADGFEHIKGLRYRQAIEQLNKCLELEPTRAECHLYLGSAYANDNQPEKGAVHYKRFLELAPNHAYYERVKGLVESYENPKK